MPIASERLQQDHQTASSTSSRSLGSSGRGRKYSPPNFAAAYEDAAPNFHHQSILKPAKSSIQNNYSTSVIKNKINTRPHSINADPEYQTTKKVHVKMTKNTERRVQRKVVLEDGRILEEEPPHVVVDTVEDTRTHRIDHLDDTDLDSEIRDILQETYSNSGRARVQHEGTGGQDNDDLGQVIDDSFQRTVNSQDVHENIVRTQVAHDLGKLSRRRVERILRGQESVKEALERQRRKHHVVSKPVERTYCAKSRRKIVDTEDVHNLSRRMNNGKIRTEVFRTEKHEIFDDKTAPDDDNDSRSTLSRDLIERDGERYHCARNEEFTDFFQVGRDRTMQYLAPGPHIKSEEREIVTRRQADLDKWADVEPDRIQQRKQRMRDKLTPGELAERKDPLTRKPLNFLKEEKTRKRETDRWLERHFGGSEWSLLTLESSMQTNSTGESAGKKVHRIQSVKPDATAFGDRNLRRSRSFSSVPMSYDSQGKARHTDFNKGFGERIVKHTTTTFAPGLEKVVYSSVTKSVSAPREAEPSRLHGELPARLFRSALSLNNVADHGARREAARGYDAGSTTSLTQSATRHIPILIEPSSSRPAPSKTVAASKDLYFDDKVGQQRLRASNSYSELARASMLNSSMNGNRRSYFYGENKEDRDEVSARWKETRASEVRSARAEERRNGQSDTSTVPKESYLRVQSEPPKTMKKDQVFHGDSPANVRRVYPAVQQGSGDTQTRTVYRSQPLYRTELRRNKLYPSSRQFGGEEESDDDAGDSGRNKSTNLTKATSKTTRSHHTLFREDRSHATTRTPSCRPLATSTPEHRYSANPRSYLGLRSMERSDAIGSPLHWFTRETTQTNLRRCQSFVGGSAGESRSTSSSSSPCGQPAEQSSRQGKNGNQTYHHEYLPRLNTSKSHSSLLTREYQPVQTSSKKVKHRAREVYEFEKKVPMHSSSLEAQKFKTIIFLT